MRTYAELAMTKHRFRPTYDPSSLEAFPGSHRMQEFARKTIYANEALSLPESSREIY
jgi:hypothetical protein